MRRNPQETVKSKHSVSVIRATIAFYVAIRLHEYFKPTLGFPGTLTLIHQSHDSCPMPRFDESFHSCPMDGSDESNDWTNIYSLPQPYERTKT